VKIPASVRWSIVRLALVLFFAACVAHAEEAGDAPKAPSRAARLLPRQLLVGPHFGYTGSRFKVSKDFAALIEPTPVERDAWFSPSYGLMIAARWKSGFTLALAPRRESYGVDTREETVSFPDNPFPHTLKASTEVGYNIWPLLLGYGWFAPRQHVQLQCGPYGAFLDESHIDWTVDDQPYAGRPNPEVRDTQSGWIAAIEYGFRIGPGELMLGAEAQRQNHSMMGGLKGSVKAESARASLTYGWILMGR